MAGRVYRKRLGVAMAHEPKLMPLSVMDVRAVGLFSLTALLVLIHSTAIAQEPLYRLDEHPHTSSTREDVRLDSVTRIAGRTSLRFEMVELRPAEWTSEIGQIVPGQLYVFSADVRTLLLRTTGLQSGMESTLGCTGRYGDDNDVSPVVIYFRRD